LQLKIYKRWRKKCKSKISHDISINVWLLDGIVYITVNELIDISWYIRVERFLYTTLICILFIDFASDEFLLLFLVFLTVLRVDIVVLVILFMLGNHKTGHCSSRKSQRDGMGVWTQASDGRSSNCTLNQWTNFLAHK